MKRHSVFAALIIVLCTASLSGIVLADKPLTVRVGAYENPPKIFTNENGVISGFWPDLVEYVAGQEGWQIEWVHGTWAQCLERLQEDEIHVMPDVAFSEERSKKYRFSSEVVLPSWSQVYTQEGTGIESILDLEGKRVAILKGSVNVEGSGGIKELVRKFDVTCTFINVNSYLKVFQLVQGGEVDAGITNKDFGALHSAAYGLYGTAIVFQPLDNQFAFPVEGSLTSYLIETVDRHIRVIKGDDQSVYYRSLEKWLGVAPNEKPVIPVWVGRVLMGIGVLVLLLVGGTFVLRLQVKEKTRALKQETDDHKKAAEALQRERDFAESLIETAQVIVLVLDTEGRIVHFNPYMEELSGYSLAEVQGQDWFSTFLPVEDRTRIRALFEEAVGDIHTRGTVNAIVTKDGRERAIEWYDKTLKDVNGHTVGLLAVGQDITARLQAEEEKESMEVQLRQSQKLESIGTLASGVAHEINNPLTGIINYADLIVERVKNDELRKFAQGIMKEGNRVAEIVKNLLSFARQEKQSPSPARIEDIINASFTLVGAVLRKDQITIEKEIPEGLPDVRCRSQQIEQVIINLLTNARDALNGRYPGYHEDKLVRIIVQPFEKDGIEWIRTTVEDHGMGIPEEVIDRIYDPFFTTKPRDVGTGLGLSVSYGIIKDHHGELTVESKPGEYTRFYMDLRVDNGWSLK